ncbi:MAG: 50S ribosomal protein L21 [Alphaproteobacteria bacterium]|jgi:large subunit ribosomal protein L21|nr:50S ribosomal protein L21 [Alphaproteobacteria bacterium]HJM59935.1 50S ribosomal protein L21 [Alphaproteobacteria bacterium]|tara:strand:+ start:204 stop:521 length:318 start_codon:yes stop_codon:yes gene_type:complete
MYAVIKTGGKQYRVAKNDVISVERLTGEAGEEIAFNDVLMVGEGNETTIGTPTLAGAKVTATVLEQARDDKVIVFKKKRRQGYRRKRGHRQAQTVLRIADISAGG